jgi:hypothetical protein
MYAVPGTAYHFPQESLTAIDTHYGIKALEK